MRLLRHPSRRSWSSTRWERGWGRDRARSGRARARASRRTLGARLARPAGRREPRHGVRRVRGVAAALGLAGVHAAVSVPVAAAAVTTLVLGSSFHRVQHILLLLSAAFVA